MGPLGPEASLRVGGGTLTRHEALAILRDGHERLEHLFGRLSDEEFVRPASIGGGDWSAKDLMGHIALWEEIALVTIDGWLRGKQPPIEETFTDGDTDALNAWNQERKQSWSPERIRQVSAETHRRLVVAIEDMTDMSPVDGLGFEQPAQVSQRAP